MEAGVASRHEITVRLDSESFAVRRDAPWSRSEAAGAGSQLDETGSIEVHAEDFVIPIGVGSGNQIAVRGKGDLVGLWVQARVAVATEIIDVATGRVGELYQSCAIDVDHENLGVEVRVTSDYQIAVGCKSDFKTV